MRSRLVALVCMLSACGPGSYGEFRAQLVGASCTWARRCGDVGVADRGACPVDTVLAFMHDATADRAQPGAIDIQGTISAGRLGYDSLNAQSCLDAVSGSPCDPVLAQRKQARICDVVVSPRVAVGNPCWSDLECVGGVCVADAGCAGVCTAYVTFGAPCVVGDAPITERCDPTVAWCDGTTCQRKKSSGQKCSADIECDVGYACFEGTCQNPVTIDEGSACGDNPCQGGTYCDPTTKLCTSQQKSGASCDAAAACKDGLACIGLTATTPGTCGLWLDAGSTCTPVGVTGCPTTQTCSTGTCVGGAAVPAAAHEACNANPCAAGLACNSGNVCDFLRATFGDCSGESANLCEPGLACAAFGADLGTEPGHCGLANAPACFTPIDDVDAGTD